MKRLFLTGLVAYLTASLGGGAWAQAPAAAPAPPTSPERRPARRDSNREPRLTPPRAPVGGGLRNKSATTGGTGGTTGSGAAATGTTVTGTSPAVVELPGEKLFNQCQKLPPHKRMVRLNLKPDTELTDLIGWISSISCTSFIIGTAIANKKVTVIAPNLITAGEAYSLFIALLDSQGYTVEPAGKFLRVVESTKARQSGIPILRGGQQGPTDRTYVTRMVRLQYAEADPIVNVLNRFRGDSGDITAYAPANTIIITEQGTLMERLLEIIRELDAPTGNAERVWLLRIKNSSATDMATRLAEIFSVQQLGTGGRRTGPGGIAAAPPPPAAAKPAVNTKGLTGDLASQMVISKIIPDERSNQLIVISNQRAYEWLMAMVQRLDVPTEGGGDGMVHVYYCDNANCDELAATLSAVAGVSVVGTASARRTTRTGTAAAAPFTPPSPTGLPPGQQGQPSPLFFEGSVRVTFDGPTNSLVVVSSLKDFQSLRKVIEKLDAPRKQVFIEALIMEVALDKTRDVGVGYHGGVPYTVGGKESIILGGFQAGKTLSPSALFQDQNSLLGLSGAIFGPALANTGKLFGVNVDIPSFGAFVQFLQKNNDVNIISNPCLLIMNNQEGLIEVGQTLPFPGATTGGFGGAGAVSLTPVVSIQRQDVTLNLKIVPSVNEHNMIRLEVDENIGDVISPNYNNLGPATSKRHAATTVQARDQQTVVIGGLMSDRVSENAQKVPFLGDIPVIGFFFRKTTKEVQKTNIIIALTPYVITDLADLRRVAEKKMRERREFIDRYGGAPEVSSVEMNVDYRRKPGMLEEMHRSANEIDDEEAELQRVKDREQREISTPVQIPEQRLPSRGRSLYLNPEASFTSEVPGGFGRSAAPVAIPTSAPAPASPEPAPTPGAAPAPVPPPAAPTAPTPPQAP